jgi:MFS family permease
VIAMTKRPAAPDSREAWLVASAALAILTIAYGAPLLSAVALKPIAAELGTSRSGPAAAGSFTYIGAAFGGIVAGWLSGRIGIRGIVIFGGVMLASGLAVSASGGLARLYIGHGVLMGLLGTAFMFSPIVTYVSRWFERRRGAAVALISSGQSVAGTLWPMLFQAAASRSLAGVGRCWCWRCSLSWRSCCLRRSFCARRRTLRHHRAPPDTGRAATSHTSACQPMS